jgi:autotransporter-associated beta strand protein
LTFNGGGGVLLNPNNGSDTTFALGSIASVNTIGQSLLVGKTASAGTGTAIITTSDDKDAQGIYGGRVVSTTDGGGTVDWATTASVSSPFTFGAFGTDSGSYVTLDTTAGTDTSNSRITAGATLGGNRITNTLKIEGGGQTLALGANVLTLTSSGLLSTGATLSTISGTAAATRLKGSASGDLVIHQYNTGGLTISAVIGNNGGATSLTKTGPGTLTLSGTNTYTGGTFVNGGTLIIGNSASPVNNMNITLNGGALSGSGNIAFPQLTVGPNNGTILATSGWRNVSNDITGAGNLYWGSGGSQDDRFSRTGGYSLSGDFILTQNDGGIWMNQFPNSTVDIETSSGLTRWQSATPANPILGGLKGFGPLTLNNFTGSLQIGNNNKDTTYTGVISGTSSALGVIKIGSGTLTLTGASTYVGNTKINAGTLQLGNLLALQSSVFDPSGAGALAFVTGINTPTFGGLTGVSNLTLPSNITALTLNPASGAVNTYSGALGGVTTSMTLTVNGNAAGKQVLSGTNTFTGATTLTAGTLSVGADANLGDANGLVFNGGTLQVTGTTLNSFGTHTPTFTATKLVSLNIADPANVFTVSQVMNQTNGGLTKSGTGTLTLTGANSYTGTTTVNAGTLLLDMTGTGALGTSALTLGGGTFGVLGKTSGATAQPLGNLTLTANTTSRIVLDPNNGTSTTLTLGNAWTRGAGSVLLIDYSAATSGTRQVVTAGATTTYTLSNGVYGGVLVKDAAGVTGFATRAAGTDQPITRYDDATLATTLAVDSNNSAVNFTTLNSVYSSGILNWTNSGALSSRSVNSLVIDTTISGGTINLGAATNILTVTSGGILFRGSNPATLTGGQIGAANTEVILQHTGTGTLTINSPISSGTGYLTLYGGSGSVVINGNNNYTGATTINSGALTLTGASAGDKTVASGAQLRIEGSHLYNFNLTLNGGGISDDGALRNVYGTTRFTGGSITLNSATRINSDAGVLDHSGTVTANGNALTVGGAGDTFLHNTISGVGTTLTKDGTGILRLNGANTYTGITTINGGEIYITSGETAGMSGPLGTSAAANPGSIVFGGGTLHYSNGVATDYSGRFSTAAGQAIRINTGTSTITYATPLTSSGGSLTKVDGTGTLTLTAANTYSGATTVNAGTLKLDFSAASAPATNILSSSSTVALGGGTLNLTGKASTTNSQTLSGTTLNAGGGAITLTAVSSNPLLLNLGSITRNVGGTVNLTNPSGTINASNGYTAAGNESSGNGLLGAGITMGGNDWATWNNTNVVAATYTTQNAIGSWAANQNLTTSGALTGSLAGNLTINSLRLNNNNGDTLALNSNTLTVLDGILLTSTSSTARTISGGNIQGDAAKDLVVINNGSGALTISAPITDNGGSGFTKSGTGTVILTAANGYTGPTTIGGGTLQVGNAGATGDLGGTTGTLVNNGTLNLKRSSALTISNDITGIGSLIHDGTGSTELSGTLSYRGTTTINAGSLTLSGTRNWVPYGNGNNEIAGEIVYINNSTLNISGTVDTDNLWDGGAVNVSSGTLTVRNAAGNAQQGFQIGTGQSGGQPYGIMNITGGSVNSIDCIHAGADGRLALGCYGSAGLVRVAGGTFNLSNAIITYNGGKSEITLTSGLINRMGYAIALTLISDNSSSRSVLNVAGGLFDNSAASINTGAGTAGANAGIINVNAGTLWTRALTAPTGSNQGSINFNGGSLKVGAASTTFIPTVTLPSTSTLMAYVNGNFGTYAGGAVIDTYGYDITIPNALQAPGGNGVSAIALSGTNGSGYFGAPYVTISDAGVSVAGTSAAASRTITGISDTDIAKMFVGQMISGTGIPTGAIITAKTLSTGNNSVAISQNATGANAGLTVKGAGATAYATISGGALTGFVMTNPGVGYVGTVSAALTGGYTTGGTAATAGTITTAPNSSGGLTKDGIGTLTLTGANTYTGNTTVNAGTVSINGTWLADTSTVTIAAGAKLVLATGAGATDTVATLVLGGAVMPAGTYNASTPTYGSYFTGSTGSLVVSGGSPPQIVVKQGTTTLSNNTGTVDFGSLRTGLYSELEFTIENSGSGALNLTGTPSVAVGGTHAGDFSVTVTPTTPVAAGSSATFTVRFTPSLVGSRTATLTFASNSGTDSSFVIPVSGTGLSYYDAWANGSFSPPLTAQLPGDNQDSDSLNNLQEFAFGTQPTVTTGVIEVSGGSVTPGAPKIVAENGNYYIVYGRRKDYVAAGLTYTVEFTAGLDLWGDNNDTTNPPESMNASDGTIDAMRVLFPPTIHVANGDPKPNFARMRVVGP